MRNLSPEQEARMTELRNETDSVVKRISAMFYLTLFGGLISVAVINSFFVQNDMFAITMTAVTCILAFRNAVITSQEEKKRLKAKEKEILSIK